MSGKRPNIFSLLAAIGLVFGALLPFGSGGAAGGKNLFQYAGSFASEHINILKTTDQNQMLGITVVSVLFGGLFLILLIDFLKKLLILKYIFMVLCSGCLFYGCLEGGLFGGTSKVMINNPNAGLFTLMGALLLTLISSFTYSKSAWKSGKAVAAAVIICILYLAMIGSGAAYVLFREPAGSNVVKDPTTDKTEGPVTTTERPEEPTSEPTTPTTVSTEGTTAATTEEPKFPGPSDEVYVNYIDLIFAKHYLNHDRGWAETISTSVSLTMANETGYDEIANALNQNVPYIIEISQKGTVKSRAGIPMKYVKEDLENSLFHNPGPSLKYTARGADHWLVTVRDNKPIVYIATANESKVWQISPQMDPDYDVILPEQPAGIEEWAKKHEDWIKKTYGGDENNYTEKYENINSLTSDEKDVINYLKKHTVPSAEIDFDTMMKKSGKNARWSVMNYGSGNYEVHAYVDGVHLDLEDENGVEYKIEYNDAEIKIVFIIKKEDDRKYVTTSNDVYVNGTAQSQFNRIEVYNSMCQQ